MKGFLTYPLELQVDSPTPSSTASESGGNGSSPGRRRGSGHRHAHRKASSGHRRDDGGGGGGPSGGGQDAFAWPGGNIGDEHRQLLGTEEESSDRDTLSDVEEDPEDLDSDVGGAGGSGHDKAKSVWAITREQLNYYTTQFFNMQPNPAGIIPGALAKEFFERSK